MPSAGNFSYTLIDTSGASHSFSDFSNIDGGTYYYDNSGGSGAYPDGYVSNQSGAHVFELFVRSIPATNTIIFSIPAYNKTITGGDSSGYSPLQIFYTSNGNLSTIEPTSFTITTNMSDTSGATISGTFSISGTTASGSTISVSGAVNNFIIF